MRNYELMLLTQNNDTVHEQVKARVSDILKEHQAEITKEDDFGIRELAYDIDDVRTGHYHLIYFSMDASQVVPLETDLKLVESLLRFMVVNLDNERTNTRYAKINKKRA